MKAFVVPHWRVYFEKPEEHPQRLMEILLSVPEPSNFSLRASFYQRLLSWPAPASRFDLERSFQLRTYSSQVSFRF